jgi:hypothetical protein
MKQTRAHTDHHHRFDGAGHAVDEAARAFYQHSLELLARAQVPFMVGGAYALERYTGITRHTKDLDVFVRRADCPAVLEIFKAAGYHTEVPFPHWIAKAHRAPYFVDIIYSGGNGVTAVDNVWFEHAIDGEVFGVEVKLCPVEEMIWSKAFIQERERFDGADVAHLLRAQAPRLDWHRLVARFGPHWRVLLSHLVLFGFIYPARRGLIPAAVITGLMQRLEHEVATAPCSTDLCQGTILSRQQYLDDLEREGLHDARLKPAGNLTSDELAVWTAAIDEEQH